MSTTEDMLDNRKRVERIKKLIIITLLVLILVPIILCIFLLIRVDKLEKKLDKLATEYSNPIINTETDNNVVKQEEEPTTKEEQSSVEPTVNADASEKHIYDRKVYLTFDDGPSDRTPEILDILKRYNVKATFFVVNTEKAGADAIYKRIVDEGHSIGVHSYTHDYNIIYKDMESFIEDYEKIYARIYAATGQGTNLFRFPGGSSSKYGKISKYDIAAYLNSNNIVYYDWNVTSQDASADAIPAEKIVNNVVNNSLSKEQAVVLMHDSQSKTSTVEALPQILEKLIEANSQILPITQDTVPVQHIVINKQEV